MTVPLIGLAIAIEGAGIGNILKPLGTLALNQPLQLILFMHFGSVFPTRRRRGMASPRMSGQLSVCPRSVYRVV